MPERLNALDGTFLELEEADESAHMHIGAVMVFDPQPGGGSPPLEAVQEHIGSRLGLLPRYRQRLSSRHTGGLRWPAWIEDEQVDVAGQVRRAALPSPGGEDELSAWAADYWSVRLDRGRPLWDAVLLEGLADGRWALATKTHHCLVDGVGSIDVGHLLLDDSPPPEAAATSPGTPEHRLISAIGKVATHPRRGVRSAVRRARATLDLLVRDELVAAPSTSLNAPIGTERRFAMIRAPLAECKEVSHTLGGTVNAVVLCAVTGGLRALLLERGEEPPSHLRAMVPVNLRRSEEHFRLGNKITSLFAELPVGEVDVLGRYSRVLSSTEALKRGDQGLGGATLVGITAMAPPVVHSFLARSLFASRLFNVTVTNVPGPQITLGAFGSRLREVWPLVPLAADHSLGVAVVSYDGDLFFGIVGDRGSVTDLDVMRHGMEADLAELLAISRATGLTRTLG